MIRVLVADDHAIVRRGVVEILEDDPGIRVVAQAASGMEALRLARKTRIDVAILDISMPGGDGLEIIDELLAENPAIKVIFLSVHPESQYALRAIKAGAWGYLAKESAPEDLVKAIRTVEGGNKYLTPTLGTELVEHLFGEGKDDAHRVLSNRELQVMIYLASGRTPSDIAADLSLSVKTISTYRTRILQKLGLHNTAEIIRYAIENELV